MSLDVFYEHKHFVRHVYRTEVSQNDDAMRNVCEERNKPLPKSPESLKKQRGRNHGAEKTALHEIPPRYGRKIFDTKQTADPAAFAAKSSTSENILKKTPNAPRHYLEGSAKNLLPSCRRTSGKMCRHNLTRYISSVTGANVLLKFGRFSRYSLKYTVFNKHNAPP